MDLSGRTLGQYRIVEKVGAGGMADVYRAHQKRLERDVAIKILPVALRRDETFRARFDREARSAARLRHPNILSIFDYGDENGFTYIVMEYARGGTLKDRMKEPLPLGETVEIVSCMGRALAYAHRRGVIHRDVKPSNVLLTEDGWPLLADFGLSKMVEGSKELTASGASVGTPEYMSPEQGQGLPTDYRSDIYSLGVMLYEMVTGQKPYTGDTPMAVILRHMGEVLPSPRLLCPDLPVSIERVIVRAMAKAPADRYQSADEMVESLQAALQRAEVGLEEVPQEEEELPESVVQPLVERPPATPSRPNWSFSIWAALAALLLLIGGGGRWAWGFVSGFPDAVSSLFGRAPTASATHASVLSLTPTVTLCPTNTGTPMPTPTYTLTPVPITPTKVVGLVSTPTATPVPSSTATSTSTPTPTPTLAPAFTALRVGTGPCSGFKETYPVGTGSLYGCFEYACMQQGLKWRWGFYLNGEWRFGALETWVLGEEGQVYRFYRPVSGFVSGRWEFRLCLEDQPCQSKTFWVGTQQPVLTPTGSLSTRPTLSVTPTFTPTPRVPAGMVWIAAGTFRMGSSAAELAEVKRICRQPSLKWPCPDYTEERPQREVWVSGFWMDQNEVTNGQFASFVEATGYETEAEKKGDPRNWRYYALGKADHPVVGVSWNDANAYCLWRGGRLPTEAEWEKAARGTEAFLWPWGNFWDAARLNSLESGLKGTEAVGVRGAGLDLNPYGLNDMAGNVWEWTADWWGDYVDPHRPPGSDQGWGKVMRGGSWRKQGHEARTTFRGHADPGGYADDVGFRCAK